jgi:hypothetical protein
MQTTKIFSQHNLFLSKQFYIQQNMKLKQLLAILVFSICIFNFFQIKAQAQLCLHMGGSGNEQGHSVVQTPDGGYAIAGHTDSFGQGLNDVYVVKLSAAGIIQWTRTVGGAGQDYGRSIVLTSDGGFAIGGYTNSFGAGGNDFYVVKLSATGDLEWTKTIGGTGNDLAWTIVQTTDGGYALGGQTSSFGGSPNQFYMVKLNASGDLEWDKRVGVNSVASVGYSLVQTPDGGFAMCGSHYSWTGNVSTSSTNFYIVKLSSTGALLWTRVLQNSRNDYARSIINTSDGGLVIAGERNDQSTTNWDIYITKLNASGQVLWDTWYGMNNSEEGFSVTEAADGGFVVTGSILPSTPIANTWYDLYMVKFNSSGTPVWNRLFGTTVYNSGGSSQNLADYNVARSIIKTTDGGFAVAGFLGGGNAGVGHEQIYFLKLDAEATSCCSHLVGGNLRGSGASSVANVGAVNNAGGTVSSGGSVSNGGTVINLCSTSNLTASATATSVCGSACTGTATVVPNGGVPPYTISWSPTGGNSETATGLCAGEYTVTVTDSEESSTSIIVNVNTAGNNLNVTASGSLSFCEGASVTLTVENGASNILWSSGQTTPSINITTSGTFNVSATNAAGCPATSQDFEIVVNESPVNIQVTPSGALTFCEGQSVTLNAASGFTNYLWSNGTTGSSITISQAGNYHVTGLNVNGCEAISDIFTVVVDNNQGVLNVNPNGIVNFCVGQSIVLTADAGYNTYLWSHGPVTQSVTISNAGTYSVSASSSGGCNAVSDDIVVNAIEAPVAGFTYAQTEGYTVEFSNTSTNGLEFLWNFGGGNSSTQENPSFTYPFEGIYPVTLIVSNDCGSDTIFQNINVLKLSVNDIISSLDYFEIFPNPSSGNVNIKGSSKHTEQYKLRVMNVLGQELFNEQFSVNGEWTRGYDFSALSSGVYWFIMEDQKGLMSRKFILN